MVGEQEPHYITYKYKIHRTKQYRLSSITIMFYLEDMVAQKLIYLHFTLMTPIYTL